MSGGGTTQQQAQTQTKDVWAPAEPFLKDIMGQAQNLYQSGAGSGVYGGPRVAGINPDMQNAFNLTNAYAMRGDNQQPFDYANSVIGAGGMAQGTQPAMGVLGNISSGQNGINTGGQYGQIGQQAGNIGQQAFGGLMGLSGQAQNLAGGMGPTASSQYLSGMASGEDAGKNPYLMQMLEDNASRIKNRVGSAMAGSGRYGSVDHSSALARSIAETNNPVLANAYESDRNRMLSASGQIDTSQRGLDASRQGALGLSGNLMGNAASAGMAGVGGQLSALQGQTGVQGQNIANQIGASSGLLGTLQGAQGQALGAAGMAPGLDQARYAGADRLLGIGGIQQGQNQAELDAQRQQFEQQNQVPWQQLQRYLGGVSPLGPMFQNAGTTTGTATGSMQSNPGLLDYLKLFGGGNQSQAAGMANTGSALLGMFR